MKFRLPNLKIQIALALSAASALIYEVVATNFLFFYYAESSYSIATVLGIFLLGLGLGSYLIYRFQDRIKDKRKLFGWLQILIAVYGFFVLANLNDIIPKISPLGIFIVSSFVFLIPTIFLGAIFPLSGLIFKKEKKDIIGLIYTSDLVGAISGTFLAGFLLIPFFGNSAAVIFGIFFNLLSAVIIIPKKFKPIPIIIAPIILGLYFSPVAPFTKIYFNKYCGANYLFYKNSPFGEVKVKKESNQKVLYIGEKTQCFYKYEKDNNSYEANNVKHSLKNIKNRDIDVLNIGLGCGVTAWGLSEQIDNTITVVEINPVVTEATRKFSDILENDQINLIIDDGLKYLKETDKKYDLILVTVDNPLVASSSPLYTVDAFRVAGRSLKETGVFSIMTIINEADYLDVLFYSIKEVFDFAYYYPNTFVGVNKKFPEKEYKPQGPRKINTIDHNTLSQIAEKYTKE